LQPADQRQSDLGPEAAKGMRFAIVTSRFNESITSKLLAAALRTLNEHGCPDDNVDRIEVPGAFEIPLVAQKLAATSCYDALICLGCVIRGETPHFDYICQWAAHGIGQVGLATGIPTIFGLITADTMVQALARSAENPANSGATAARCAIEMVEVIRGIESIADKSS
jgi:6,7-dimethyl-8-ribityllumazine synthase